MKKLVSKKSLLGLALLAILTSGCLVSGTFVIVHDFSVIFTADGGFYWWPIDLTTDPDWEDHQDDIDDLDALGLVFTIENTSDVTSTFNVLFAAASGEADPYGTVTYAESLGYLGDMAAIKTVVLTGRFDYYGTSTGGSGDDPFVITDGSIIVTISASGSGS